MQKLFIIVGIIFIIVGLTLPWIQRSGLGHLPGDFVFKRENFTFYFPLMTCIVLSVVVTLVLWFFNR